MIERAMTVFGILALAAGAAFYLFPRVFPAEHPGTAADGIDLASIISERAADLPKFVRIPAAAEYREIMQLLASSTEENANDCAEKLRHVLAGKGESAVRRAAIGWALLIARNPEEARKELDRAFEIDPGCPLALAATAYEHLRHRRFGKAEESFRRALAGFPVAAEWRWMHSRALMATGRGEEALAAAESSVVLAPRNPMYYLAVGDVHLRLGRFPHALRWYEAACRMAGPESKMAVEHEPVLRAMRERLGG